MSIDDDSIDETAASLLLSEVKLPQEFANKTTENVNYTPDSTLPPECYY